jgi:ABC-type transport system involved in cytochrome bd biosynthesis fused ATPase/permease subunit
MGALSDKTVLVVTHQVEFLHAFDSVLVSIDAKPSSSHLKQNRQKGI